MPIEGKGAKTMTHVNLYFPEKVAGLSGSRYGKEVYQKQIKDYISETDGVLAIIPKQIKRITKSFYDGLFADLVEKYGNKRAHEMLVLCAPVGSLENTYE